MSFLYIHSTDASTATGMDCEIKSSCFSSVCEKINPMTVFPASNVTLNCSIGTEGLTKGMTWNQMLERVQNTTGLSNLILERWNSTTNSGKHSCQCTLYTSHVGVSLLSIRGIKNNNTKSRTCPFVSKVVFLMIIRE